MVELPWERGKAWPNLQERGASGACKELEVPEWASRLAGFGHWTVTEAANGHFHRAVIVVPVRETAAIWLALGALMAGLGIQKTMHVREGDTVWIFPPPQKPSSGFTKGTIEFLPKDPSGLFGIKTAQRRKGSICSEQRRREQFVIIEKKPDMESARIAEDVAKVAKLLAVSCESYQCLALEDAIQIIGGGEKIASITRRLGLGELPLEDLLMLDDGNRFSMCRNWGGRRARPNEKAKLVVIDGIGGLEVLEDDSFSAPAIAVLTTDEWEAGQPDSERIANALGDWGEPCTEWPADLEMPGIGCLIYWKEASL